MVRISLCISGTSTRRSVHDGIVIYLHALVSVGDAAGTKHNTSQVDSLGVPRLAVGKLYTSL